jgi:hypothetical protein
VLLVSVFLGRWHSTHKEKKLTITFVKNLEGLLKDLQHLLGDVLEFLIQLSLLLSLELLSIRERNLASGSTHGRCGSW